MNLLWCHSWTGVRGDGLDARSRCGNWAGFGGVETVVPLEVLDQIFDVLVESLWLLWMNRNCGWLFSICGHAGWMPDSESLCVDHRRSREDGGRGRDGISGKGGNE